MAPTFAAAFLSFACAWWSRDLLTDWLALLQVEGQWENAAMRLIADQLPYVDFHFTNTPGIVVLHALAQKLGIAARYLHLLAASLSVAIVFHWSAGWGRLARATLLLLLLTWSFTLWNISHPAWPALAALLAGVSAIRSNRWALAGLFLGLAFWLHQQIGLAAAIGTLAYIGMRREGWRFLPAWAIALLVPASLAFFAKPDLVSLAISQIEWLPATPLQNLPKQVIGAPLVVMGLWVLSLYFFRSTQKLRGFSILAVLAYAMVGWMREGRSFLLGCFFLFSLLVWIVVPLLSLSKNRQERNEVLGVWMPIALLGFLFTGEFPSFLWLFPLTAFLLVWSLSSTSRQYQWLPRGWFFAPAFLLLFGGVVHQSRLLFLGAYASMDSIGRKSYGEVSQVSRDLAAMKEFLLGQDRQGGILVLPNAPYFYVFSGIRNATPFDVVVQDTFDEQTPLMRFFRPGGRFLVIQGEPPTFLSSVIRENFSVVKTFGHFSIWRVNGNGN